MYDTLVMIMAGGRGERLYPLTRDRAKPAVPFGGRYRIIDFALSNFINSGFMRIKVLTQYLSYSLLVHLSRGYNFGSQSDSYVDAVPAEQGAGDGGWYMGTAHAIFMNLNLVYDENPANVAVFGGDHIYKMDVRQMLDFHRERKAACTVACLPYPRAEAAGQFGIIEVDDQWRIVGFEEKPADPKPIPGRPDLALVSMGNYFFNPQVLSDVLHRDNEDLSSQHDFGKNVIPGMIGTYPVYAYNFLENEVPGEEAAGRGYWRDVGTIESYYEASMDLRSVSPQLNLYNFEWPVRSTVLQYPPAKFVFDDDGRRGMAVDSLVSAGSVISGASVRNSIIFANNFIHSYSQLNETILFHGCNIGRGVRMTRVICDKNVSIEDGAVIGEDLTRDAERFHVSPSGIVVIPKNTIIPREGPLRMVSSSPPPGSLRPRVHPPGGVQISPRGSTLMRIAYVTPELHPLVKTGGLGDVSGALTRALAESGHDVTAYLPAYGPVLAWCKAQGLKPRHVELPYKLELAGKHFPLVYGEVAWQGVKLVLVGNDGYFARPHPYLDAQKQDYPDNLARFAFFCRATAEHLSTRGAGCDILHLHDWQTAPLAAYRQTHYAERLPASLRTVLTIHNLGYQGSFPVEDFPASGLAWQHFTPEEFEFYGRVNLLKGGIVHADAITTVSPTYAAQIQTPEYGHGLDGVLRAARHKLTGILNGIDTNEWNPATDPHLYMHYTGDDLSGKARCKALLQSKLGLPARPKALLLSCVSRFDRQKGINLIIEAWPQLAMLDIQLVLLGSGNAELEAAANGLAARHPEQVAVQVGFDESLAHQIEAGADLFLMPSVYEPCGLNQLYSQRYGTLPLVHATGGLKDTVADGITGFSFDEATTEALAATVRRAAKVFFTDRRRFNAMVRGVMALDNSWQQSAQDYVALYQQLSGQVLLLDRESTLPAEVAA